MLPAGEETGIDRGESVLLEWPRSKSRHRAKIFSLSEGPNFASKATRSDFVTSFLQTYEGGERQESIPVKLLDLSRH